MTARTLMLIPSPPALGSGFLLRSTSAIHGFVSRREGDRAESRPQSTTLAADRYNAGR